MPAHIAILRKSYRTPERILINTKFFYLGVRRQETGDRSSLMDNG
ncbi:hypothetical protein [Okeania sp. SIO2C2]|nr:hypothetical protein [Okeania sp. SIO2C2]